MKSKTITIYSLFLFLSLFSQKVQGDSFGSIADSLALVLKNATGAERLRTLNAIAWEYRNKQANKALKYIEESLSEGQQKGFEKELADAYRVKASIHWNLGNYTMATEYALKGLSIFESVQYPLGIANSYIILGNIYNKQGNTPFSVDYYKQALAIFSELGEQNRVSACLNNLATLLTQKQDYAAALVYLEQAIQINKKLNNAQSRNSLIHNFNNLGYLYYKQGTYDSALINLRHAYSLCEEIGDDNAFVFLHETYLTYSYIYFEKKQYEISLDYAKKALASAEQTEHKLSKRDAYKQLTKIYSQQKNIQEAHRFGQLYIALNDSIFNEESIRQVAAMQAQYESAYKDKEIIRLQEKQIQQQTKIDRQKLISYLLGVSFFFIVVIAVIFYRNQRTQKKINAILAGKNMEIERQRKALELLNATKDKFFSIIAHDLRSPLNSLKGFSNFLANYTEGMTTEEIKKIATDLNLSVNNTLDLTNNLLAWARLQMDKIDFSPAILDINEAIKGQVNLFEAAASLKNNKLTINLLPNLKVFADEDHLNFVLRNLIANAIKFTQNGEIFVKTIQKEGFIEIAIKDTGAGMDTTFMEKIFSVGHKSSTLGTAGEKGTGLGLPLCKEFVEKNGGNIWVNSTPKQGSTFFFTLPTANP